MVIASVRLRLIADRLPLPRTVYTVCQTLAGKVHSKGTWFARVQRQRCQQRRRGHIASFCSRLSFSCSPNTAQRPNRYTCIRPCCPCGEVRLFMVYILWPLIQPTSAPAFQLMSAQTQLRDPGPSSLPPPHLITGRAWEPG